jgi:hypothetical protein
MKQIAHLSLVYITYESLVNLLYEHPEAIAQTAQTRLYTGRWFATRQALDALLFGSLYPLAYGFFLW